MAEREGFEPPVGFPLRRFSRPERSTTLPPLRYYVFTTLAPQIIESLGESKGFQDRPFQPAHASLQPVFTSVYRYPLGRLVSDWSPIRAPNPAQEPQRGLLPVLPSGKSWRQPLACVQNGRTWFACCHSCDVPSLLPLRVCRHSNPSTRFMIP